MTNIKSRVLVSMFLFALLQGPSSGALAESKHESHDLVYLNTALHAARRGQGERALDLLQQQGAGDLCPQHAAQHHGIACQAHLALGDAAAARSACALAIEADGSRGNWRHYNNLGVAEYQLGNTAAAVEALETAVLRSGVVVAPRRNLAAVQQGVAEGLPPQQVAARLRLR